MQTSRVILIVVGVIVGLIGFGMLIAGGVLLVLDAQRDADGYFTSPTWELTSDGYAITAEDIDLAAESDPAAWTPDFGAVTTRLTVEPADGDAPLFVGIGRADSVDRYLGDVAHDRVQRLGDDPDEVTYRPVDGDMQPSPPTEQAFWAASASGDGTQTLTWDLEQGRWAVVVMNADGSQSVDTAATAGVRTDLLLPIGIGLVIFGLLALGGGVALVVGGAIGGFTAEQAARDELSAGAPATAHPVRLTGELDPQLSRWQWLVKWLLAIPHFIVLALLWIAFPVVTLVAGIAILFTGRYPRGLFAFTSGVLRWTWRVSFYSYGVLGTDRYPPFSLADADYPASLNIAYPEQLSRGLVLIKWWLLAIPHYIVLGVLFGGTSQVLVTEREGDVVRVVTQTGSAGLISVLVFIAAVGLLFTGRYPRGLFDFVMGLQRWVYRVIAYVALMTDEYPPFRLDSGGAEPPRPPRLPDDGRPGGATVDPTADAPATVSR